VNALLVAVGGAAGSVLRYWMAGIVQHVVPVSGAVSLFPLGTMSVNVVGCLIIGALVELGDQLGPLSQQTRSLLLVGFLGGFTTFSAFANETVAVWRAGAVGMALLNVVLSVVSCLMAVVVGRGLVAAVVK
jgi:CrcB protein